MFHFGAVIFFDEGSFGPIGVEFSSSVETSSVNNFSELFKTICLYYQI